MTRNGEQGVALVFTLFLMAALSAMAVSMMFLAQTETSASRNYKTMSQARYAGEAGVQRAIHYLSSTAYSSTVTTTGFDMTVSPVRYNGAAAVLKPVAAQSNHPSTAIKAAFAALFTNASLSVGSNNATASYTATATLLSMRQVTVYGGSSAVLQTWRIDAVGAVQAGAGTVPATVEVSAILDRDATYADTYAIFATGTGCGAITLGAQAQTDSYDSSAMTMSGGVPVPQLYGGSVGTNGNLTIGGTATVRGNLDTPRTGVGNCTNGNITALNPSNQANVTGDTIQLPQSKTYPAPTAPATPPPTSSLSISGSSTCASFNLPFVSECTGDPTTGFTIATNGATLSWGNVAVTAGVAITISQGYATLPVALNVNSFSLSGNASLNVATGSSVVMNVAGAGVTGDVVDLTGGSFTNPSFDPSKFQILYAGTSTLKLAGGTSAAMIVYAPNAPVRMEGNADFYGSVLSAGFDAQNTVRLHYDRSLGSKLYMLQNHVMSSFSWQKY
jgi:hypothetical protein